jgi:hypothetical protein
MVISRGSNMVIARAMPFSSAIASLHLAKSSCTGLRQSRGDLTEDIWQMQGAYPQNGRFIMENPIQMDNLGVPPFQETSI